MTLIVQTAPHLNEEDIGLIQGIQPDSVEEWRMAVALYTYKYEFQYQRPVGGGHRRGGGQVIDFLVETRPLITALFIDGEYWHKGRQRSLDIVSRINLKHALRSQLGHEPKIVELFASELYDQEATNRAVLEHLGRV